MLALTTTPSAAARTGGPRPRVAAAAPHAVGGVGARRAPSHARRLPAGGALHAQQQAAPAAAPTAPPSSAFAASASGEWEGAAAAFARDGAPVELPPNYVPDAFREWGVSVCDWQTQCSTDAAALEGGAARVAYRLKRLLPSVGCEADATAFVDEGVALDLRGPGAAFAPDGGYVASAPALPASPADPQARVEVALPLPTSACRAAPDGTVPPRRVRAVLTLAADPLADAAGGAPTPSPAIILRGVELFSEKRYADFSNGSDSLAGCGGGVGPFAGSPRLEAEALERGPWTPRAGTTADPARGTAGSAGGARLLLPLGAWAAVRPAAGGGILAEAGFVVEGSDGVTVRRAGLAAFDGAGRLVDARLTAETAGSSA